MSERFRPFHCRPSNSCHPSTARCDGKIDCVDYSDEDHCSCAGQNSSRLANRAYAKRSGAMHGRVPIRLACKNQPYQTYMCKEKWRCLKQTYVCNAASPFHCPGEAPEDVQLCQPQFDPLTGLGPQPDSEQQRAKPKQSEPEPESHSDS